MSNPQEEFYAELEKRKFFHDLGKAQIFDQNPDFVGKDGVSGVNQQLQRYTFKQAIEKLSSQHKTSPALVTTTESVEHATTPQKWIPAYSFFGKTKEKPVESEAKIEHRDETTPTKRG
jgi:hypothetical protein